MKNAMPKHFDYLPEHASELEGALGLNNLSRDVDHWRRTGMEFPDEPLVGCRKCMELALRTLAKPLPDNRMNLQEVIEHAEDVGILDRAMAIKCHEIRRSLF